MYKNRFHTDMPVAIILQSNYKKMGIYEYICFLIGTALPAILFF
jgi:hypothetical protein